MTIGSKLAILFCRFFLPFFKHFYTGYIYIILGNFWKSPRVTVDATRERIRIDIEFNLAHV